MTMTKSGGTAAIIKKYDVKAQKKYGQNFLIDENVLRRIVDAAGIGEEDTVLEIGPGTGALTAFLCEKAGQVIAVEIDKKLMPILEGSFKDRENVTLINGDIMKIDILSILPDDCKSVKVAANLPYYITTPIIMGLLEKKAPIESMTIMIQKEVAERMLSLPGKKTYGALSLAVQYHTDASAVMEVPPNCFIPRPKVSSSVMHLKVRKEPSVSVEDEELLFEIIRASFNQRRKTLLNGLKNYPGLQFSPEEISKAIETLGKPSTIRGEQLSLEEFAKLSDILGNIAH
ncbi:MAG: 16S rRNA (adenine(1518)-N(6)/adenine(1519)-N(6))-dimethyltransferase RsmA [Lachnospiraceae bacterium]|nr:16S rRNA (adenine(1518)-N(6)/adenine(1519)-N(6))-dimethyltransferase RsmA [Lachnospiraceae bacterium]